MNLMVTPDDATDAERIAQRDLDEDELFNIYVFDEEMERYAFSYT